MHSFRNNLKKTDIFAKWSKLSPEVILFTAFLTSWMKKEWNKYGQKLANKRYSNFNSRFTIELQNKLFIAYRDREELVCILQAF